MSNQLHGYTVIYGPRSTKLYAKTSLDAREKGIEYFKVPANKQHQVMATLAEIRSAPVKQVAS